MAASDGEGHGHGRFDVIVVGAGIMGSCAASSRGARVLLLERFDLLHHGGSSHGESRTIRAAYPPMVRLSRRLWDEAQADAGYAVPTPTPHLDLGPADDPALVAAIRNGGAGEPWPWAGVFDGWTAAPSELGGVMKATKAVAMFQALAVKNGAVLRDKTEVVNVTKRGEGEGEGSVITVRTSSGEEFHGTKCIVTVGAWTSKLIKSVTDFHDTEPLALALMEQLPPPTAIIRTEDRMKVHVAIGNYQLTALIDSGANKNYISPTAARRVGLPFDYSMSADVVVGNGDRVACRGLARDVAIRIGEEHFTVDCYAFPLNRNDMVLGVEYLRTLGRIVWDFDELSMEFWHHGKRVLLKGIGSTRTEIPPTGRSNLGNKKRKPNTEPNLPSTSPGEAAGSSEPRPKSDKKPNSRVTGPAWVN